MKNEDNTLELLTSAIKELSNVNNKIEKFNEAICQLSENLNILINTDRQEEIAIAANDVNHELVQINKKYKEFLKDNNITENLNGSLDIIKNSLSILNKKVEIIEKKSILQHNTLDKFPQKINMCIMDELGKIKNELIKDMKNEYRSILKENNNNILNYKSVQSNFYGRAFLKDDYIYYISRIDGNKIHKYNLYSKVESIFDIASIVDGEKKLLNIPKSIKISYANIKGENKYLLGIAEKDRSLYSINFITGKYEKLARYCIDFLYLDGYVFALVHNNIMKIKLNSTEIENIILLKNEKITESKGSLGIFNNNIFINFNKYNFIFDIKTLNLINIL